MALESKLQKEVIKKLQSCGAYVVRPTATSKAGVPDLLVCYKGKFIGIELKVDNNKPSELQKAHIILIEKAGGIAKVVRTLQELNDIIKDINETI